VVGVGTGSGAIALSLAAEGAFGRVVATDVSPDALELARENAVACGVADRIEFRRGALFEPVAGERFDVVVSNPPYVAERDREQLAPEVVAHEPALALFGGADGLAVLEALIRAAPGYMEAGGLLALEIGAEQGDTVLDLARRRGAYEYERITKDLAQRPRFLLAERAAQGST
jgi:release factor glutamine methyltransferase